MSARSTAAPLSEVDCDMAKSAKPKSPSNDATERDAMDAVEDALAIDFNAIAADDDADPYQEDPRQAELKRDEPRNVVQPRSRAANDDVRAGTARLRAALAKKPSSSPFWFATLLSLLWIGAALWAGFQQLGEEIFDPRSWASVATRPELIYLAGAVIIPLLFIWAYAFMLRRSAELKLAARSMTEAAYRLIEPETEASNAIRTVGQAVRGEVVNLTEGIEQAMRRAGELETLVHSEVASLEGSYSDNELRMRGLVQELAAEREAIVQHTERVRSSIAGASEVLQEDLTNSARQISETVSATQQEFAASLAATNEDMKTSLSMSGETLLEQLGSKGEEIGSNIEQLGKGIVLQLDGSANRATESMENVQATLGFVSQNMISELDGRAEEMSSRLTDASEGVMQKLIAAGTSTVSSVEDVQANLGFVSENLNETLTVKSNEIIQRISDSATGLVENITSSGSATVSELEIRTKEMAERVSFLTGDVAEKLETQFAALDERMNTQGTALVESLGQRSSELSGLLEQRTGEASKVFESGRAMLAGEIGQALTDTQEQLDAKALELSMSLAARVEQINQNVSEHVDTIDAKLA
ncbi:MAG: hypothetical protein AAF764_01970, partial [Pseudomonadota bacterium]